jgi:hypothetical protein
MRVIDSTPTPHAPSIVFGEVICFRVLSNTNKTASSRRAGAEDAAKTRPVAWTFLPFIERKCHKAFFDQILCRTPSADGSVRQYLCE